MEAGRAREGHRAEDAGVRVPQATGQGEQEAQEDGKARDGLFPSVSRWTAAFDFSPIRSTLDSGPLEP